MGGAQSNDAKPKRWEDSYRIGPIIGRGTFSTVHSGLHIASGREVAIKIIQKQGADYNHLLNELTVLSSLSHPLLVKAHDIYWTPSRVLIVMDMMEGGELFDVLAAAGTLSEAQAAQLMRDIVRAVEYLHSQGVVHRDIKPQNVLVEARVRGVDDWPLSIKLADFGLSSPVDKCSEDELVGSFNYVAPEMARGEPHGTPVDMWACGVMLYVMIAGRAPFAGQSDLQKLASARRAECPFPEAQWRNVSDNAKSLVRALLQESAEKRLTASAALEHPFLREGTPRSTTPIGNDISGIRRLRRSVTAAIVVERIRRISQT